MIKNFRSTKVAVKYFEENTTSSVVEKEAKFLKECCHLNLLMIYGTNNITKPYYIVMQIYLNEGSANTFYSILDGSGRKAVINMVEHWLLFITELVTSNVAMYLSFQIQPIFLQF